MYSFPYLEPVCCSMSSSNCCFLTCIQTSQEADKVVWYSHHLKNFPHFVVIHTLKGFSVVNEAEIVVFWNSLAFSMIQWMLAIWSSSFLKHSFYIWKFSVHVLLKPSLENFEHYFASVWNKCNCAVVWKFLALPVFGIGMKTDLFQSCGHCWVFQICWHTEYTLTISSFRISNSSTGILSPPLAFL